MKLTVEYSELTGKFVIKNYSIPVAEVDTMDMALFLRSSQTLLKTLELVVDADDKQCLNQNIIEHAREVVSIVRRYEV